MISGGGSDNEVRLIRLRFEISSLTNEIEALKASKPEDIKSKSKIVLLNLKLFAKNMEFSYLAKLEISEKKKLERSLK